MIDRPPAALTSAVVARSRWLSAWLPVSRRRAGGLGGAHHLASGAPLPPSKKTAAKRKRSAAIGAAVFLTAALAGPAAASERRPGFVYVEGGRLMLDGAPYVSKGANWLGGRYISQWPVLPGGDEIFSNMIYMYPDYYNPAAIERELKDLRKILGVNTLRLPVVLQVNEDGSYANGSDQRLLELTRMAHGNGIRIHYVLWFGWAPFRCPQPDGTAPPCPITAWGTEQMNGAILAPPDSRDEQAMLRFARATASLLKDEPGVLSYEFFNETLPNRYLRIIGYQEQVVSLVKRLADEVRRHDPDHLIAEGEVTALRYPGDPGVPWLGGKPIEFVEFEDIHKVNDGVPFSLYDVVDFVTPHLYIYPGDSGALNVENLPAIVDAYLVNSAKPVVLGECNVNGGAADTEESDRQVIAAYMDQVRQGRLQGIWVWDPISPVLDLMKPGTFEWSTWTTPLGGVRPLFVSYGPPLRRIRLLAKQYWLLKYQENAFNIVGLTPAAGVFAGRNAQFVSQSVPATVFAGRPFEVTIAMRNTGETTWQDSGTLTPLGYVLGAQNPHDNSVWGGRIALLDTPVAPDQTVIVNATVTAPSEPGTYDFQYRMLQTGVEWFGEATPNVAVTVLPNPGDS